ncbi:MAG: hypothetical protein IJ093_01795, partial [Bacilli bacterium]|nr:hypothetical protein [Bacilli bacterium]
MKKVLIIIILIIVITIICFFIFRKKTSITSIQSLHISYTTGTAKYSNVSYDLVCNEKCIVTIKPNNIPDKEALETEVSQEVKKEIEKVLKKYHVETWDKFNKSDQYVMDGSSFSISIDMEDNNTISASGYMKCPKNYKEV